MPSFSCLEVLETRIAPAVFFLSGVAGDLTVRNAAGAEVTGAGQLGSTATLLLNAGDSLVFDANGDATSGDAGDYLLGTVAAGRALVFLTDFTDPNGGPSADDRFQKNEITGLAVGNGFRGSFFTDINGPVATVLQANGTLALTGATLALQRVAIAGLSVRGEIDGAVLAGGSVSNVIVGEALFNVGPAGLSIEGDVATGNAAGGRTLTFDQGGASFTTSTLEALGNGPGIANVRLVRGASGFFTGDGATVDSGIAGNGGSISGVRVTAGLGAPTLVTGSGGGVNGSGTGGSGGSILNSSLVLDSTEGDSLVVVTGAGGSANADGVIVAGRGGAISGLRVEILDSIRAVQLSTGDGGMGRGTGGRGGAGGAISSVTLTTSGSIGEPDALGSSSGTLQLAAGTGGSVDVNGPGSFGGAGGSISAVSITLKGSPTIQSRDMVNGLSILAGNGGIAADQIGRGLGGVGGDVRGLTVSASVQIGEGGDTRPEPIEVLAGRGAEGPSGGRRGGHLVDVALRFAGTVANATGITLAAGPGGSPDGSSTSLLTKGGAGGSILRTVLELRDSSVDTTTLSAGAGGAGAAGSGAGGKGGDVRSSFIGIRGTVETNISIVGGRGGETTDFENRMNAGAAGGSIIGSGIRGVDGVRGLMVTGSVDIVAGSGEAGVRTGGTGGVIRDLVLEAGLLNTVVSVRAGDGGSTDVGKAGAGGSIQNLDAALTGTLSQFSVLGGMGGGGDVGGITPAAGGAGGSLSGFDISLGASGAVELRGGTAGDGSNGGGGAGGALSAIALELLGDAGGGVAVLSGPGGVGGGERGASGNSGSITNVLVTSFGEVGSLVIQAASQSENLATGAGVAGNAGSVSFITVGNRTFKAFDIFIGTGSANAGAPGLTGGRGGAVSDILVSDTGGSSITISAGPGASVEGPGSNGGSGGSIARVRLDAPDSEVQMFSGFGGSVLSGTGVGGAAGSVTAISGRIGELVIFAGIGGDSLEGRGGRGGSIAGMVLSSVRDQVTLLAAGDGGFGGGAGGSVSGITVPGSIGDFSIPLTDGSGIQAGQGGVGNAAAPVGRNGSVFNVVAERIAAIIAGFPNPLTVRSAVYSISGIRTAVLGAETGLPGDASEPGEGGVGIFNYDDNNGVPGFQLGSTDRAVDGLVIVRAAGLGTLPVTPLRLFAV